MFRREAMDSSPPEDDYCSICHDRFTIPCQGQCILHVWLHGSALQPCKCPICRRSITLLIPSYAALQERQDPESNRILENIEQYKRNFRGGPYSLVQRLRDLPFFTRRLLRKLMDPPRSLPFIFRARMIVAIVLSATYVLSPVDILPEGDFGFVGLLDDLFILLIVLLHLATSNIPLHTPLAPWKLLSGSVWPMHPPLKLILKKKRRWHVSFLISIRFFDTQIDQKIDYEIIQND